MIVISQYSLYDITFKIKNVCYIGTLIIPLQAGIISPLASSFCIYLW